jgi:hypothetical protein
MSFVILSPRQIRKTNPFDANSAWQSSQSNAADTISLGSTEDWLFWARASEDSVTGTAKKQRLSEHFKNRESFLQSLSFVSSGHIDRLHFL